jgi:hypothetical protein
MGSPSHAQSTSGLHKILHSSSISANPASIKKARQTARFTITRFRGCELSNHHNRLEYIARHLGRAMRGSGTLDGASITAMH